MKLSTIRIQYANAESTAAAADCVTLTGDGAVQVLTLTLPEPAQAWAADATVQLDIPAASLGGRVTGALARGKINSWWTSPSFTTDFSQLPAGTQNLLLETESGAVAVLPLCGDSFAATVEPSDDAATLRLSLAHCAADCAPLHGAVAVISTSTDPYEAVRLGMKYACHHGLIDAPLRTEKTLPEIYRGFGWCTWNAFYHDVTEQGIYDKLAEFRAKGLPVRWVMIDDGWSQYDPQKGTLLAFEEDRTKFPSGLRGCIARMKQEYGVEQVGVWHAITGYWSGIEKGGALAQAQADHLAVTPNEMLIPTGRGAYPFFREWHEYLKAQGVDFVKIDAQGNMPESMAGTPGCLADMIAVQAGVDRSVQEVFGGNVINCMGMLNQNAHHRPFTALSRNSDDFFPDREGSFRSHILQNGYNAVFHGCLYYCDFDMWWTRHPSAKESGVLRAVSGGPVYVSDRVGETDADAVRPLLDANGGLLMAQNPAMPTRDCLFRDPSDGVLKLFNTLANGNAVVAAFNLSDRPQTVTVRPADFGGTGDWTAYRSFAGKRSFGSELTFTLAPHDTELVNFYIGDTDRLGDTTKYLSAATV